MNNLKSYVIKSLLVVSVCVSYSAMHATTLPEKVELEAQLKEMRTLTLEELAVPAVTGLASGFVYHVCMNRNDSLTELIGVMFCTNMAKKIGFGVLHEKENKREAINSLDTFATLASFLAFYGLTK